MHVDSEVFWKADGSCFDAEYWSYPIFSQGRVIGSVVTFLNITDRLNIEKELEKSAITDDLTGLLNRRGFFTLAEQQCRLTNRTKRNLALLYIDLDNMKYINDTFTHKAGDRALVDTADMLGKTFRKSDILGRIGGDEFAILLTEPSTSKVESLLSGNIRNNLDDFNKHAGRSYTLSFSIGFAHFDPENPCSIMDMISTADAAMYEDKKRKKV